MAAVLKIFGREPAVEGPPTSISIKTSPKHEFVGHQDTVGSFVFLKDNVHIVSGSLDGTLRKWNCETRELIGEPWKVNDEVLAMALSPDGKTIACGRGDGSVQLWDTDGRTIGKWTGHSGVVRSVSWSPSGSRLASGSFDGTILIRNAETGEIEVGSIKANQGPVWSIAHSPKGDRIASGGDNVSIWDSNTGNLLVSIQGWTTSVVWSLDGNKVYSARFDIRVLDSKSGKELHRFQDANSLYSIALSPQYNLLTGVGYQGIAQLWDTESNNPLGHPFFHKDSKSLESVSFSPDGRYLAYSGDDKKITLRIVKVNIPGIPVGAPSISQGKLEVENYDEERNDVALPKYVAPRTAKRDNGKGKQREEPVSDNLASIPRNLHSPTELDSNENSALWKPPFPQMDGRRSSAKVTQDRKSESVAVYAARGSRVNRLVVHKREHRAMSLTRKPSAPATPAGVGGSPQSSQRHAGLPSRYMLIAESAEDSYPTETNYADNYPCSGLDVQGSRFKFLKEFLHLYECYYNMDPQLQDVGRIYV